MEINQALEVLSKENLFAEYVGGTDKRIIGGTEVHKELGFKVYKDSFAIYYENPYWVVSISGPGQLDTTQQAASIESAVNVIVDFYWKRRMKP